MKVTDIIEGLQIIQKSKPADKSDYHFRAEHDIIYVGSLEWEMPEEDRLKELGWDADKSANGWVADV